MMITLFWRQESNTDSLCTGERTAFVSLLQENSQSINFWFLHIEAWYLINTIAIDSKQTYVHEITLCLRREMCQRLMQESLRIEDWTELQNFALDVLSLQHS